MNLPLENNCFTLNVELESDTTIKYLDKEIYLQKPRQLSFVAAGGQGSQTESEVYRHI